jgi:hypothetical protein
MPINWLLEFVKWRVVLKNLELSEMKNKLNKPPPIIIDYKKKITRGNKVQKYSLDGILLETYNGLRDVSRKEELLRINEKTIRNAINYNYTYKNFRWLFLDRDLPDDTIQILPENYDITGNKYYLKNIDFNKYRFRLIDGLDLVRLTEEFFWILDAEVSEAIIGLDEKQNLVWYKGIWEGGRWFGGTWISGTWKSGDWYDGVWTSKLITDNFLNVKVDKNVSNLFIRSQITYS